MPPDLLTPGLNGHDSLAVGLRSSRVVYSYNLGSGVASLSSDPLDLSLGIHTVRLGRHFRKGWLKVESSLRLPLRLLGASAEFGRVCAKARGHATCPHEVHRGMMSTK